MLISLEELELYFNKFLSSPLAFYLFDATRYRMKYLEKYVFALVTKCIKNVRGREKSSSKTKYNINKNIRDPGIKIFIFVIFNVNL